MKQAEKYAREYYTRDHGITQETLDSFGIVFRDTGTVVLPYEGRLRERIDLPVAPASGKRFIWGKSEVPITPFNVDDGMKRTVFLTEGESDAMRLWQDVNHEKIGVVGLPGVESWKDEWVSRFEGAQKVFVVLDNPAGYDDPEQLDRGWRKIRAALGNRCRRVYLRDDCKDLTEFLEKYGYPVFKKLVKQESTGGKQHWEALDLTQEPTPPNWLLQDVLACDQTNVMIGEAWGGKSFWYLGLMQAILDGKDTYCGLKLDAGEGRILIFDEENPPGVPIFRMRKLGLSEEKLRAGAIRYINRAGIRLERDASKLMDEANAHEPSLIVFDAFDRLHRMDNPNSSTEVSAVFTDCLMPLATATGAAVLVLHHENKPPPPPKDGKPAIFRSFAQRSRGSGALAESADQGVILEVDPDDNHLRHIKMGGSRSSSRYPGDTLCSFRIVDVPGGVRIRTEYEMPQSEGDLDDDF